MYEIHFRKNLECPDEYCLPYDRVFRTIEQARDARIVSGDLVVNPKNRKIITDRAWLWPWELEDVNSYAHKAILWQIKQDESR